MTNITMAICPFTNRFNAIEFLLKVEEKLSGSPSPTVPAIVLPIIIKIFTAAVLGGIGHIAGSIFGSFIIASAEVLGSWFFTPYYKDAFSYIILIIVLLVRPQGLFGKRRKHE